MKKIREGFFRDIKEQERDNFYEAKKRKEFQREGIPMLDNVER